MIRFFYKMVLVLTFGTVAYAAPGTKASYKYILEAFGGLSSVNPAALNDGRQNFIWNATGPSSGNFSSLRYLGGSFGKRIKSHLQLSLRYEQEFQILPKSETGLGTTTVDYFIYNPLLLMVEFPFTGKKWSFSFGGGIGYSLQYEFHQQYSGTQEDITYVGHPIVFRGRVSIGYQLGKRVSLFVEGCYDKVSANSLATTKNYLMTVNGTAITSGQTFNDASGNDPVKVDMSGIRYGGGLRVTF